MTCQFKVGQLKDAKPLHKILKFQVQLGQKDYMHLQVDLTEIKP